MLVAIVFLILLVLGLIFLTPPTNLTVMVFNFLSCLIFFLFIKRFFNLKKGFFLTLIFFTFLSLYVFDLLTIDRILLATTFFIGLYWLMN